MRSSLYRLILATLLAVAMVAVISSCEDRGTNVPDPVVVDEGFPSPRNHDFDTSLILQINNPTRQLRMVMYVPAVSITPINDTVGDPERLPLLVLLAPQDMTQSFYFDNGLKQIADELIATGEIEPMAILSISNDRRFVGGYFYSGHYEEMPPGPTPDTAGRWYVGRGFGAGNWDKILTEDILEFAYEQYPFLLDSLQWRGIGGVGQGGYGALRAAVLSRKFASVSAMDAPLDFDGPTGNGGLIPLMPQVLTEQGLTSTTFKDSLSENLIYPLARLFIGGALAFSPEDTGSYIAIATNSLTGELNVRTPLTPRYKLTDSVNFAGSDPSVYPDSSTLITTVVSASDRNLHFHLPFDSTGTLDNTIWPLWMENNLENMIAARGGIPALFGGVDLWFAYSPQHRFGFGDQTKAFADWFIASGYPGNIKGLEEYTGYDGFPATLHQYVADHLRDILIFHNNKFRAGE